MTTNRYRIETVTGPATEPLTLTEAKSYLRIDASDEDALLATLISSATEHAELHLNRRLITQTIDLFVDCSDRGVLIGLQLPIGPVQSITEVAGIDADDGAEELLDPARYYQDGDSLIFAESGAVERLRVRYQVGYGAGLDVPSAIKTGLLIHVAALYEHRGVAALPEQSAKLYRPYINYSHLLT